jgi:SPP1 family predicted phage head-tail adaptor
MTDVITLIKQTVTTNTYGIEEMTETERVVFARVDSISQTEFYQAANTEFNPELRFTVFFDDYQGERLLAFNDGRYSIYRTYRTGDDLELYAERKVGTWQTGS